MYAWVRRIALRLAPARRGSYLHLRAGFERLGPFPFKLKFSPVDQRLLSTPTKYVQLHQTLEPGATIAAVYPERRQP
jgi:predicted Holliday junction resolvase-like endonuclease